MGQCRGDNLTNPALLITAIFFDIRSEGYGKPRNEVGFQSPDDCFVGYEPATLK